jgi:glucose-6-phosphate isomerase
MTKINDLWTDLYNRGLERQSDRIENLFELETKRLSRLTMKAPGILVDLSKNLLSLDDLNHLFLLSEETKCQDKIAAMFAGEKINATENREALHVLLRQQSGKFADQTKCGSVRAALKQMQDLVSQAHNGGLGYTVRDVVNIGIGGSHLGPALVCDALRDYRVNDIQTHFISNVDGGMLETTLSKLRPETTLFVVASKSFTTSETLLNASSARTWFEQNTDGSQKVEDHFLAASSAVDQAMQFGISRERIFPMWDWVGGRYSLWSTIGLPIALQCGFEPFEDLLAGAAQMDSHFAEQDLSNNLPAVLALVGIWHNNFLQSNSRAVVPYDDRLRLLPSYLQQLEMESNGKQVDIFGEPTAYDTSPVVWGGVGTDAQHAFFQQLHQGTLEVPIDFIICKKPHHDLQHHHQALIANCLAQAEGLMTGTVEEADPARLMVGNHSSNMIVLDELTPTTLGTLLAMYEHRTMFQGAVWQINSFDQFGVELGKKLANNILSETSARKVGEHDPSTLSLMNHLHNI